MYVHPAALIIMIVIIIYTQCTAHNKVLTGLPTWFECQDLPQGRGRVISQDQLIFSRWAQIFLRSTRASYISHTVVCCQMLSSPKTKTDEAKGETNLDSILEQYL